jgi:hypothetical protein
MTFLERLRRQRFSAISGAGISAKAAGCRKKVAPALVVPLGPSGGANGVSAGKAKTFNGALLRQTVEDVFDAGAAIGLPGPLVARLSLGLDQELRTLRALDEAIAATWAKLGEPQRGVLTSIPGRILHASVEGLAPLDAGARTRALHAILEGIEELTRAERLPWATEVRALEGFAHAIAKLKAPEMGAEMKAAFARIVKIAEPPPLEAASDALAEKIDVILASGDARTRAACTSAAIDIVLTIAEKPKGIDARKTAKEAIERVVERGVALTAGQQKILTELAIDMKRREAEYRRIENDIRGDCDQQKARFDGTRGANADKVALLGPIRARTREALSLHGRLAWFHRLNINMGQPPRAVEAIARVHLELLAQRVEPLPNANALKAIENAVIQLSAVQGVSPEALAKIAEKHIRTQASTELVQIFSALAATQKELFGQKNNLRDADLLAILADSFAGRAGAFLPPRGARTLLVGALAEAPSDAARHSVAAHAPPIAQAIKAAEAGKTRDHLEETFAKDMAAIAKKGTNLTAIAATYPAIPEDSLAALTATAQRNRFDLDKWFGRLSELFAAARGNKDYARSLRSILVLADQGEADVRGLLDALLKAKLKGPVLMRTVNAVLREDNHQISRAQIERVIRQLEKGDDVAASIEHRMNAAMMKNLDLAAILKNAKVKVTDEGLEAVQGPLAQFFAEANQQFDKDFLRDLLISVLEGTYPSFRFTTRAAKRALRSLDDDQKRQWMKAETMTHVRFDEKGQREFDRRVKSAANIAGKLAARMTAAWGKLEDLEAKREDLVKRIRGLKKNELEARRRLIAQVKDLPGKISVLGWATDLAAMTPDTTTPLRFAAMADGLSTLGRALGPGMRPVIEELIWTIRLNDLAYSEVVTHDGPSLEMMMKLVSGTCIHGAADSAFLAYCVDPNKRMIYTKNGRGETRRAVLRLVERRDPGHVGEPMLLLECPYPRGTTTKEERQRLIEHTLRRATEMGIPAAYPTEYYWDASKTGRFQGQTVNDMNAVIKDLNRRYSTVNEMKAVKVLNPAGNMDEEYIDSAPTQGADGAGNAEVRRYNSTRDHAYENMFVILSPA